MPEDEKTVQGEVSGGTQELPKETPPGGEKPSEPPQPLTEKRIADLIKTGIETGIEGVSRRFQSEKDKGIAAAQREAREALARAQDLEIRLANLDPEAARIAQLEAKERHYASREREEYQAKFDQDFHGALSEFIIESGLDPNDKRIDWGTDIPGDYLGKQKRVLASVGKIQKEDRKATEVKQTSNFKDMEQKLRRELGLDSVDTSLSGGVRSGSDDDFIEKIGSGEIKLNTKENVARARKLGLM